MTAATKGADGEFAAMHTLYEALDPLDDEARARVVGYIVARLDIVLDQRNVAFTGGVTATSKELEAALQKEQATAPKFGSFAELADAARPQTLADRALVAGYWLQVCQAADSFDGYSANKALKDLGHGIANITMAIDALRSQSPALALQLKKSGTSRQARKTYKLTVAGIKAVESMISAPAE
jgi:hypothetical protein